MARVIDKLPGEHQAHGKYPWSEWTDGQVWLAVAGEDFTCAPESFRAVLHNRATFERLSVSVRKCPDGMAFQFSRNGSVAS